MLLKNPIALTALKRSHPCEDITAGSTFMICAYERKVNGPRWPSLSYIFTNTSLQICLEFHL